MNSRILVITPTYERPEMCRRAIDSLVAQQCHNWTAVIAKNWGDHRLAQYQEALGDVLELPNVHLQVLPKRGLGYALNQAATAYLGFHDAFAVLEDDDEWDPTFLPTMFRELRGNGAHVAHCLQRQVPRRWQSDGGPMNRDMIRSANWINFPMCLFRSDLYFATGGFSGEVGPATDWDWHLRCLKAGARYHFVNRVLVTHHWHNSNYCRQEQGRPAIMKQFKKGTYG